MLHDDQHGTAIITTSSDELMHFDYCQEKK